MSKRNNLTFLQRRSARAGLAQSVIDPVHEIRTDAHVTFAGKDFAVRTPLGEEQGRVGILLRGGCDLPSAFTALPQIADDFDCAVAVMRQGTGSGLGAHRTDQMLSTTAIDRVTPAMEDAMDKLRLGPNYFRSNLFDESTFEIDGHSRFGTFPKSVVVLSVGSDLVRALYRHRDEGFLVDPGGFWLDNLEDGITELQPHLADWFRKSFRPIGRIAVGDFQSNLRAVIGLLRSRLGAEVIVYNTLVVDPGTITHNYQLLQSPQVMRKREFNVALSELSAELDFHIVDIDRILKGEGVTEQVDFAHFSLERMAPIGKEVCRILRDLELVR